MAYWTDSVIICHSRHFCDESERFLSDVLLPNLVWHAGRTAAAVRTSALSCLLALLHGGAITHGQLLCLEERLSPLVFSALEEDSQMSRLLACRSLSATLELIGTSLHHEALNKIYPGRRLLDLCLLCTSGHIG
ncbi:hypothetical protein GOODEAATRI_014579 [Goodea atripinnis]|uniref:Uncharacterized protein n=1 Tax=Goodea atripinnis TaxID=208336 RepID=A0ABV0NMS3_9TELE